MELLCQSPLDQKQPEFSALQIVHSTLNSEYHLSKRLLRLKRQIETVVREKVSS